MTCERRYRSRSSRSSWNRQGDGHAWLSLATQAGAAGQAAPSGGEAKGEAGSAAPRFSRGQDGSHGSELSEAAMQEKMNTSQMSEETTRPELSPQVSVEPEETDPRMRKQQQLDFRSVDDNQTIQDKIYIIQYTNIYIYI